MAQETKPLEISLGRSSICDSNANSLIVIGDEEGDRDLMISFMRTVRAADNGKVRLTPRCDERSH